MRQKSIKNNGIIAAVILGMFFLGALSADLSIAADTSSNQNGKIQGRTDAPPSGDIKELPACPYCGMNRQKFAHSRILVEYDDGSVLGACSIHCAAVDMAVNIDKAPMKIWVGDYNTKNLIDAEKALWTIGGDKMGVMTKRAKWAFGDRAAADRYIKAHGGEIAAFESVMEGTYGDMYKDTRMIREKRKKMRMMKMKQ